MRECAASGFGLACPILQPRRKPNGLDDSQPSAYRRIRARCPGDLRDNTLEVRRGCASRDVLPSISEYGNTQYSNAASVAGHSVVGGMIWQGLEQDKYWTGREIQEMPVLEVKNAIAARLGNVRMHPPFVEHS